MYVAMWIIACFHSTPAAAISIRVAKNSLYLCTYIFFVDLWYKTRLSGLFQGERGVTGLCSIYFVDRESIHKHAILLVEAISD